MPSLRRQRANGIGKGGPVRIVIVDDHIFMRDLMVRALARKRKHYEVVAAVGTAADAIASCERLQPDLLILDINLPDQNGIDALPELRRVASKMRVLLCTGFPTDDRISDLAAVGAHGFVEKTNSWDRFLSAIESVSRGECYFCAQNGGIDRKAKQLQKGRLSSPLTTREREIIVLVAHGFTSKEIAAKLNISVATVENHRTNLMNKLGVRNVAGLVSYAVRMALVRKTS